MVDRPNVDGIDAELLDRYLAGECSEQETALVRRHLMAHPEVADALAAYLRQLDGAATRPPAPDARTSWEALQRRMREPRPVIIASHREAPRPPTFTAPHLLAVLPARHASRWRSAAAIVCVIGGLAAAGVYRSAHAPASVASGRTDETFLTTNRERAELRLSDGTRVHLAPASRLRVAADFGEQRRDVYLDGEGYFDVEHDARKPFSVHVRNTIARDLGTEFAVRAYGDDETVQVVVRKGAVAMSQVGTLGPGDLGQLGLNGTSSVTHGVPVDELLGWLTGRLAFRDAPLAKVLTEMRRWHDTDVRLGDPTLAALPFTGVLTDASFRASLDLVAATLGLRVRREGDVVTLERATGARLPNRTQHADTTPR